MTENFCNLKKGKPMKVQEAQSITIKSNPERPIPRHIITKIPNFKVKERILKAAREKQEVT